MRNKRYGNGFYAYGGTEKPEQLLTDSENLAKLEDFLKDQAETMSIYHQSTSGDDWNDGYFKCIQDMMELIGMKVDTE